jgi:hypothetical protein
MHEIVPWQYRTETELFYGSYLKDSGLQQLHRCYKAGMTSGQAARALHRLYRKKGYL